MSVRITLLILLTIGMTSYLGIQAIEPPASDLYQFPDLPFFPTMPLSSENPVTYAGVNLGRHLFYDPILSADSSISCASCHRQSTAFADGGTTFSKGIADKELSRNTMPLFNLAWNSAFFWDGRAQSIEEQVFHPVRDSLEMGMNWPELVKRISQQDRYKVLFEEAFGSNVIDSIHIARAIAQFERTLLSYRSKYDRVLRREEYFTSDEYQGFVIVNDQSMGDCLHCHSTDANALGTTGKFSNNGLDPASVVNDFADPGRGDITNTPTDAGKFKIPSLRNVALTAPYMHDGRFQTLEEVLDFYSEGVHSNITVDSKMTRAREGGVHFSEEEKRQVLLFLHTLTDSALISDPDFSNPYK